MAMADTIYSYDLTSDKKKFGNVTIDAKNIKTTTPITFSNDIAGQVVRAESGKNVVITAYDLKDDVYTMVKTTFNETTKKYEQTTYKYDGSVTGDDKWVLQGKAKIVNALAETKYYKNGEDYTGSTYVSQSVNPKKVLGKITIKNGDNFGEGGSITLTDKEFTSAQNLFASNLVYDAIHKGNKYTGTFLKEEVSSTKANETFALGTGLDKITFADRFGKDTVTLAKGATLTLDYTAPSSVTGSVSSVIAWSQKGNDALLTATVKHTYSNFAKIVTTVAKKAETTGDNAGKYKVTTTTYSVDTTGTKWAKTGTAVETYVAKENLPKAGTAYTATKDGVSTSVTAAEIKGFNTEVVETLGTATMKNYFKNAEAGAVTVGSQTLAQIFQSTGGHYAIDGIAKKNNTLKGTFLNDVITGAEKNDKITTGAGADIINATAGKDTITIDGVGAKTLNLANLAGATTVSFGKKAMSTHDVTTSEGDNAVTTKVADTTLNVNGTGEFSKSGNNLVVTTENGLLTVSNFLKTDYVADNTTFGGSTFEVLNSQYGTSDYKYQLVQKGAKSTSAVKFTDTAYNDDMIGGVKKDTFNFVNGGYDRAFGDAGNDTYNVKVSDEQSDKKSYIYINDTEGNDTYNVKNWNESVYINDEAGDKDVLAFDKSMKVGYVFDVASGAKDATKFGSGENLTAIVGDGKLESEGSIFFYDSSADIDLSGMYNVNVKDFYSVISEEGAKKGTYAYGEGYIETVKVGKSTIDFSHLDEIRSQVANFLSNTKYATAYDLLKDTSSTSYKSDVEALIAEYAYKEPSVQA